MRFYAACLASYNAGTLHGAWVDASTDVDAMQEAINAMLRASPHPNVIRREFVDMSGAFHTIDLPPREPIPADWTAHGEPFRTAEEYAVHDYDDMPSALGEFPGLETIAAYVELIEAAEDKDIPADVAAELADSWRADDIERAKDTIEDEYQGAFDSLEDWAWRLHDDLGTLKDVPDTFQNYINFAAIGRDAELGGDIRAIRADDGRLYVFWNQ